MDEVEVKEYYEHWLPPILGAYAVTIGNSIYYQMQKHAIWTKLRKHEMKHVEQYNKYTVVGFLIIYLFWYVVGRLKGKDHHQAYLDIPFEIEARKAEGV
jgi:hypothetical protein